MKTVEINKKTVWPPYHWFVIEPHKNGYKGTCRAGTIHGNDRQALIKELITLSLLSTHGR